jgi:hypothetical protein
MPNGVPEALTFVADADATVPASTSVVVVPSNQGDAPGLIVGYIDGSGDFQVLGDVNGIPVQGTATIDGYKAATPTASSVADTATSTTILAANGDRTGFSIVNTSSARLYLAAGGTASATNLFIALSQWQECSMYGIGVYTGAITGVWASDPGDGVAAVTEFEE